VNILPDEQESHLWRLDTDTGTLCAHVTGTGSVLDRVRSRVANESPDRANPNTLSAWLAPVLIDEGAIFTDRLDSPASNHSRDPVARIKAIQKSVDAPRAFMQLLALFDVAGETEIDELIASPDLTWVREYIASVLRDLEEFTYLGIGQLRAVCEPQAAYALLPSPRLALTQNYRKTIACHTDANTQTLPRRRAR
jgi:hypothetical protein